MVYWDGQKYMAQISNYTSTKNADEIIDKCKYKFQSQIRVFRTCVVSIAVLGMRLARTGPPELNLD